MKHKALLLMLAVALFVVATPVLAGADSSARPFKASVEGARAATPTTFSGTGIATHLGNLEFEGEREFGPFNSELCAPFLSLEVTLTAANGDELNVIGTGGENCIVSVEGPIVQLEATADAVFDGGTGRFVDASGQVTLTFDIAADTSTGSASFVGSYEGTIGY